VESWILLQRSVEESFQHLLIITNNYDISYHSTSVSNFVSMNEVRSPFSMSWILDYGYNYGVDH
jgi:hypothetical protein